jgi:hypothetical protein
MIFSLVRQPALVIRGAEEALRLAVGGVRIKPLGANEALRREKFPIYFGRFEPEAFRLDRSC